MEAQAYIEMGAAQTAHWWFAARREILREQLRRLDMGPQPSILEIGSGTGANLDLLSEFGTVTGFEMSPDALQMSVQCESVRSGRSQVVRGRCPQEMHKLEGLYDAVCLFDVLEHLDDDIEGLKSITNVLRPGGRVLMTVPAYPWLWSTHDQQLHHRRRYTARTLTSACASAGLDVTELSHFNTLLFPLALVQRVLSKTTGSSPAGTRTPHPGLNNVLRAIFASEKWLLGKVALPFGLSLFAVAGRATS